jgi:hypothetical protein
VDDRDVGGAAAECRERRIRLGFRDAHVHAGMRGSKRGDDGRQQGRERARERHDLDASATQPPNVADGRVQRGRPRQQPLHVGQQFGAGGRGAKRPAPAINQRQADVALERRELLRDGGLRVAQGIGGGRHRAVADDRDERAGAVQIEGHSALLIIS